MFSDSAVTNTVFGDEQSGGIVDYDIGNKLYSFPGYGCVTVWGFLNNLQPRLGQLKAVFRGDDVLALRDQIVGMLRSVIEDDESYPEVGCHIGGFVDGRPSLWHVFWGKSRPRTSDDEVRALHVQDESHRFALYNGRNAYVHELLALFRAEERAPVHSTRSPWSRLLLGAHIIAFIGQLTHEVSEPVKVAVIRPDNRMKILGLDQIVVPPSESTEMAIRTFLGSVDSRFAEKEGHVIDSDDDVLLGTDEFIPSGEYQATPASSRDSLGSKLKAHDIGMEHGRETEVSEHQQRGASPDNGSKSV